MENKFGFKDFCYTVLMLAIIVSIWVAMVGFNRQHDTLRDIESNLSQLTSQQAQVRSQVLALSERIADGVAVAPGQPASSGDQPGEQTGPTPGADDPFDRIRAMREHPDFAEGDRIIDAFGTNVPSLNVFTSRDVYARRVSEYVTETLISRDPDTLEFRPHLARSWAVDDRTEAFEAYEAEAIERFRAQAEEDPSVYQDHLEAGLDAYDSPPAEGSDEYAMLREQAIDEWVQQQIREDPDRPAAMYVTFNLRRNVVFSDATPMTAHDVVFTWEWINNPEVDAPRIRNFYDMVETFEAVDDYTVRFGIREPFFRAFELAGGLPILPKHFIEEMTPREFNQNPGVLIGTGPYRLSTPDGWRPGDTIRLVRNENYWGPQPAFDQLIWLEISNDVARLTEYRNQEIDIFAANPEQYQELLDDEAVVRRSHTLAFDPMPAGYNYIAWNQQRSGNDTRFADRRVRQAMTYLTPRKDIAEAVYRGYAQVANGPFSIGSPQADPSLEARERDTARAMELLAEAGWELDGEGNLRNEAGERFRFTLTFPSDSDIYDEISLHLRDAYARAGIVVDLDRTEWSVFRERLSSRRFDAIMLGWGGGAIESDIRQMFHSSQIAGAADNFISYNSPELDEAIDRARRTIDDDVRMQLWQECHRILHEDQPYTFMFQQQTLRFIDDRVENIEEITTGINDREEWFVPEPMQRYTR